MPRRVRGLFWLCLMSISVGCGSAAPVSQPTDVRVPQNPATSDQTLKAAPKPDVAPVLPAKPTRFLIIGDSQTQKKFGWGLDYLLREGVEGSVVATYATCASTALSWISGTKHRCGGLVRGETFQASLASSNPKENGRVNENRTPFLLNLLHTHKPDVVLIALGENYKGAPRKSIAKNSGDLALRIECYRAGITSERGCKAAIRQKTLNAPPRDANALRCMWIMPPYTRIKKPIGWVDAYYASLREGIEPVCEGIDSRWMTCIEGHKNRDVVCDTDESRRLYFNYPRSRAWALGAAEEVLKRLKLAPLSKELRAQAWKAWDLNSAKGAYGIFPIPKAFQPAHAPHKALWEQQRKTYGEGNNGRH